MSEVICVGSAAADLFATSHSKMLSLKKIEKCERVCIPIGSKTLLDHFTTLAGGSAINSSTSLKRLGISSAALCIIGPDIQGKLVLDTLKKRRVKFIGKVKKGQTGASIILSGPACDRVILAYKGVNDCLEEKDFDWREKPKWFYFGSMLSKSLRTQFKIAKYARSHNIPLLYNPSLYVAERGVKKLSTVLKATRILVLNLEEAQALIGKKYEEKRLIKELSKISPIAIITLGARGAISSDGTRAYKITPRKVKAVDTTGAGDAFASAFLAAIMRKKDIPTALRWGCAQAQSVISEHGATSNILNKNEIERAAKKAGRVEAITC
ncbi:carbohydrate kinase family protein [Candidatus Woesearchaeota archaeon]|nr:MAG: carbohydrate kinase family protein [Candidatus Woesearchaeota archaeon]